MAKCALTGKHVVFGRNIRHQASGGWARRAPKTNRTFRPNIHAHTVFIPELGRGVRLMLSAKALRTISKKGLMAALRDEGMTLKDILNEERAH